ncbi:nitrogenase iron-molybdenum cofactor biosynthesis protein NifE [Oscillospiraceae bacterium CM]|nr:nitrogenase iron-molybdenum cofactor biosynthesis protein NifE [Oscillospiraceae bacterium CM]
MNDTIKILKDRQGAIAEKASFCCGDGKGIRCEKESVSGAVTQRACVYCGARVVLNPITDAYHIVHGPIGCASYTWDIRGSLTSGADTFRTSFSTDLRETDVIFGGEKKLAAAIDELVLKKSPKLIFIYATCIVGVIGDDVEAICREKERQHQIRVIPVKSPGFSGTKSQGYKLACDAIMQLILPNATGKKVHGVNLIGDFNLAGEMWTIRRYLEKIGIPVVATATGDASLETLLRLPTAQLNLVQCAGSSAYLAARMEEAFGIPAIKVSFFGTEDTESSLLRAAEALGDAQAIEKARALTTSEGARAKSFIDAYKPQLAGKRAAIYVGGGFKAISLIRQFNELGMETVVVGTQTGKAEDYEIIASLVGDSAVILDDASPSELEKFMVEKKADILVGGVKERPLAYKLGIAFCDHNHERRHPLAGYEGIRNFVREINLSVNSPVWQYCKAGR